MVNRQLFVLFMPLSISHKFKQIQMQNVDSVHFSHYAIISVKCFCPGAFIGGFSMSKDLKIFLNLFDIPFSHIKFTARYKDLHIHTVIIIEWVETSDMAIPIRPQIQIQGLFLAEFGFRFRIQMQNFVLSDSDLSLPIL